MWYLQEHWQLLDFLWIPVNASPWSIFFQKQIWLLPSCLLRNETLERSGKHLGTSYHMGQHPPEWHCEPLIAMRRNTHALENRVKVLAPTQDSVALSISITAQVQIFFLVKWILYCIIVCCYPLKCKLLDIFLFTAFYPNSRVCTWNKLLVSISIHWVN